MAQSAVEWLATYLKGITSLNCDEVIQQAKEMENKRTIEFAEQYNSYLIRCSRGVRGSVVEMDAEQYYKEVFEK
jgi:hypothetical protein